MGRFYYPLLSVVAEVLTHRQFKTVLELTVMSHPITIDLNPPPPSKKNNGDSYFELTVMGTLE